MDGYGCVLSAKKAYPECRYMNVGYGDIVSTLHYMSAEVLDGSIDTVYITDLNFDEICTIELYKQVKHYPSVNFTYVDHHPFQSDKQFQIFEKLKEFPNFKMVHTEKRSATYIFYKYLLSKELFQFDESYEKLMSSIDAYDTWKTDTVYFKPGLLLNDIFYNWPKSRFMNELLTEMKITDNMKKEMKSFSERKTALFKRLQDGGFIIPFGNVLMFLCDDFVSHMTIDYPGYKYYVNGRSYGGVSVRISQEIEDPKHIKDHINKALESNPYVASSGGHDHAFGITLQPEYKNKMLSVVETLVKELSKF